MFHLRDRGPIPWEINDILQKTKLNVDENGLEAAVVTAIVLEAGAAPPDEQPEPVEFIANRPFTFYIYSGFYSETPLQLFAGQYVRWQPWIRQSEYVYRVSGNTPDFYMRESQNNRRFFAFSNFV